MDLVALMSQIAELVDGKCTGKDLQDYLNEFLEKCDIDQQVEYQGDGFYNLTPGE